MPRTLLISGTLASQSVHQILRSQKAEDLFVVEVDSLLDRSRYASTVSWQRLAEFIPLSEALMINQEAESVADFFLSHDIPSCQGTLTSRAFRSACFGANVWRLTVPYLLNRRLAEKCLEEIKPHRLIVAAGNGVHFEAWREVAAEHQVSVTFFAPEPTPVRLTRRLVKWWLKRQRTRPVSNVALIPSSWGGMDGAALCTSERLSRLLAEDGVKLSFPIGALSKRELGSYDGDRVLELTDAYRLWWDTWQKEFLQPGVDLPVRHVHALRRIGKHMVEKVYPVYAAIYEHARKTLTARNPRAVLCDTQMGTSERMWSFAASELGIPVVAYNYDHMPNPRFGFMPDYLLADSGRSAAIAVENGIPQDRVVMIRSHRRSKLPQSVLEKSGRPLVVYSDSYYAGARADIDPASCYASFNRVIEAARLFPDADFIIKFHPLREKKKAELCFVAMDETELRLRKDYIRALRPPKNVRLVEPEESLPLYLARASVLLNYNSTSGVEAFEMGVPVVFMQAVGKHIKAYPRIHEYGACLEALDAASLSQTLGTLLSSPQARAKQIELQMNYLRTFYWPEGTSLQESLEKIQGLLNVGA